jgi:toxin YoeB
LKKNGGKAITNKIEKLLIELIEHPRTGTGQVEQLKGNRLGQWSRRIDKNNRLIYSIDDEIVTVEVLQLKDITETNNLGLFLQSLSRKSGAAPAVSMQ